MEENNKESGKKDNRKAIKKFFIYLAIFLFIASGFFAFTYYYGLYKTEKEMYSNLDKADLLLKTIEIKEQIKLISLELYNESEVNMLNNERKGLLYVDNNRLGRGLPYKNRLSYVNEQVDHIKRVKKVEFAYNISLRNQIEHMALEG